MFGKLVIRLGDPTSHGGQVVSASSNFDMFGKQVARIGDTVTCPQKGHGVCTIVEGDPTWTIDGRNVALEGHKTSCGAVLISTLPNVHRSYEGMGTASFGGTAAAAMSQSAGGQVSADENDRWIKFDLDEKGSCEGLSCIVHFDDGSQMQGEFDADNQVAFYGVSGNHVERIEFVMDEPASGGPIAEALLDKLER